MSIRDYTRIEPGAARKAVEDARLAIYSPKVVQLHRATVIACNGNCNQGRACDCVADVETEPDAEAARRFWLGYIVALAAIVGAGVLFALH